jgi:hypothetical protein
MRGASVAQGTNAGRLCQYWAMFVSSSRSGNVTAGKPANLVLEGAQNQREFLTTMAVFKHAHARGNRESFKEPFAP